MLFGFEAMDVLIIVLTLSVLNLLFGRMGQRLLLIWLPTVILAGVLRIGKRGKPEGYLLHLLKYQFRPGIYSAYVDPTAFNARPRLPAGRNNQSEVNS